MTLTQASLSIAKTQRGRFAWAVWFETPSRVPWRAPDRSGGGFATWQAAHDDAARTTGVALRSIEPLWARAFLRTLRGQPPLSDADVATLEGRPRPATPAQPRSCWQILGIPHGRDVHSIKKAFRERALLLHPDQGGDPEAFLELRAAYSRALRSAR